jgi:hypothetical protein
LPKPEPELELMMDDVPVEEEYPDDSEKWVRVPANGHSAIASSSETRHEPASRRESMKSGLGMWILILSPVFPLPLEAISESSDVSENRSVGSDGANNDGDDDDIP